MPDTYVGTGKYTSRCMYECTYVIVFQFHTVSWYLKFLEKKLVPC
jgi:hypothetical protein